MHRILSALLLLTSSTAFADLPCREGGVVATNGSARVVASAHGCRAFPTASFTVEGQRSYTIASLPGHHRLVVSETGRTLILLPQHLRAGAGELVVYRDGYRLGAFPLAEILGAEHRAVSEDRFVTVGIESTTLVVTDVDGTELHRAHLRTLPYRG
ncbi:MAG: hypothetical protein AAGE52_34105 [Myxococcota bacterium]